MTAHKQCQQCVIGSSGVCNRVGSEQKEKQVNIL